MSTLTDTRFPSTTLFRSLEGLDRHSCHRRQPLLLQARRLAGEAVELAVAGKDARRPSDRQAAQEAAQKVMGKSEEHTSELQLLMRISYAVFCLEKKTQTYNTYR